VEVQLIPIGIEREAKSSGKERWWKIAGAENVPTSPVWARRPLCPESGQTGRCLAMSALCHKATFAPAAIAAYRVTFPFGDSGPSRPWLRSRAPGRLHHFGRWFWLKDGWPRL